MAVLQSLLQMATDWDEDVRLASGEALGRLADERSREILTESLSDATRWVRQAAGLALKRIRARRRENLKRKPGTRPRSVLESKGLNMWQQTRKGGSI
jgi:HEAT repeat protein